jgi:hypothetical protein
MIEFHATKWLHFCDFTGVVRSPRSTTPFIIKIETYSIVTKQQLAKSSIFFPAELCISGSSYIPFCDRAIAQRLPPC